MHNDRLMIDTARLELFAAKYETVNNNIKNSFQSVQTSINLLRQNWSGNAATAAIAAFDQMKTNVCIPLETSLLNVSGFLKSVVSNGYIYTEKANTSLADAFK